MPVFGMAPLQGVPYLSGQQLFVLPRISSEKSLSLYKPIPISMSKDKKIQWLFEELSDWEAEGIVDQNQAQRIRARYDANATSPDYDIAFIIAGVLGTLLVGGGIVLIVAYNWEELSQTMRTALSFAPLVVAQVIYGYAYFRQPDSIAWVESASVFLMLMIAASIGLISDTYHLWGNPEDFLWYWLLLSIPLLYLMNSSLVTMVYLIGIATWTVQVRGSESVWYWALLAAALPHIILNLSKKKEHIRRNLLGWVLSISFIFSWFGTIENNISDYPIFGTTLIFSLFFLLGTLTFSRDRHFIQLPFSTFAVIGTFIFLLLLTFDFDYSDFSWNAIVFGEKYTPAAGTINFGVLALFVAGNLWLGVREFSRHRPVGYFIIFLPLFALLLMGIERSGAESLALILANLYLLAWGIAYLVEGIQSRNMNLVNLGMLIVLLLATARFFDTDWSPLLKGAAFIVLGSGFLFANWRLARRLKATGK